MRFIDNFKKNNFIKIGKYIFIFSILYIAYSIYYMSQKPINFSLDFNSGIEIIISNPGTSSSSLLEKTLIDLINNDYKINNVSVHKSESKLIFTIKEKSLDRECFIRLKESIIAITSNDTQFSNFELEKSSYIGPQVSSIAKKKGEKSIFLAVLGIFFYIYIRFGAIGAISSIIALLLDCCIALSVFIFFNTALEFGISTVAAMLTIIGYSVNNSVVFLSLIMAEDKDPSQSLGLLKDKINHVCSIIFSRSVLTSVTTFLSISALIFIRCDLINGFTYPVAIGILYGTTSSMFVVPFLVANFTR